MLLPFVSKKFCRAFAELKSISLEFPIGVAGLLTTLITFAAEAVVVVVVVVVVSD